MSKARSIIMPVIVEGHSQADTARLRDVSPSWVSKLVGRYRTEGDAAFQPRSQRLASRSGATNGAHVGEGLSTSIATAPLLGRTRVAHRAVKPESSQLNIGSGVGGEPRVS